MSLAVRPVSVPNNVGIVNAGLWNRHLLILHGLFIALREQYQLFRTFRFDAIFYVRNGIIMAFLIPSMLS